METAAVRRWAADAAWKPRVFRYAALGMGILTLTVMGGIAGLCAPWFFLGSWPGHEFPDAHRFHDA